MYDKLKIIKIFLSTILIVLTIIALLQNTSKAYTWEDFIEITEEIAENGTNANIKTQTQYFLENRKTSFKNYLDTNNINFDYQAFIINSVNSGNQKYYYFYCMTQINLVSNYAYRYVESTNRLEVLRNTKMDYYEIDYNGNITYENKNNTSNILITSGSTYIKYQTWGLTNGLIQNFNYEEFQNYENMWNYFNLLGATNRDINLLPWYFADARIGNLQYDNNNSFKLYDINNNFKLYLNAIRYDIINGYLYQLEIPYTQGLTNGGTYYTIYKNSSGDFYKSQNFIISWEQEATPRRYNK